MMELGKFVILAESRPSLDAMEVDHEWSSSPVDQRMVEAGGLHLKRARSPPRLAQLKKSYGSMAQGPSQ